MNSLLKHKSIRHEKNVIRRIYCVPTIDYIIIIYSYKIDLITQNG